MTDAAIELDDYLSALEWLLSPGRRMAAVDALVPEGASDPGLDPVRRAFRSHAIPGERSRGELARLTAALDRRTRDEGLHVLHGWDFRGQRRPADIAAVLLVELCEQEGFAQAGSRRRAAQLLIDHYLLGLLSLAVVRAWDAPDPPAVLDRVTRALTSLHGPDGAPWAVVADAESLLMLAVAYYHPEEPAYDRQLARVQTLEGGYALRFASACCAVMASHLRWGLRFMYASDVGRMRDDNVIDYPWLLHALLILARERRRLAEVAVPAGERDRLAGALVDGLSPDPWAFDGPAPRCLAGHHDAHAELRGLLDADRAALIDTAGARKDGYSPLGLSCNFIANAVVASVATTVAGSPCPGALHALFQPGGTDEEAYARSLMAWAAARPERLGAGGVPLVVYDRRDAAHFANVVARTLREGVKRT